MLDVDVHTYLPGDLLVKVDIASMAYSLEARSPFLDHHMMEFLAAAFSSTLRFRGYKESVYSRRRCVVFSQIQSLTAQRWASVFLCSTGSARTGTHPLRLLDPTATGSMF